MHALYHRSTHRGNLWITRGVSKRSTPRRSSQGSLPRVAYKGNTHRDPLWSILEASMRSDPQNSFPGKHEQKSFIQHTRSVQRSNPREAFWGIMHRKALWSSLEEHHRSTSKQLPEKNPKKFCKAPQGDHLEAPTEELHKSPLKLPR